MDCNILLLGQTGVGKSSLLNYLAGEELAEAGIPTGSGGMTRGIHRYSMTINGQPCRVSDSEGFELENLSYWEELIERELANRSDRRIRDWYHIIVFCIGANGARVQDFELSCLTRLLKSGYGVVVAFTKVDMASDEELDSMKKAILDELESDSAQMSLVEVCSRKTRSARPMGKEALCEAILGSWRRSLIGRLPDYVFAPVTMTLKNWQQTTEAWIDGRRIGLFGESKEEVYAQLMKKGKGIQKSVSRVLKKRTEKTLSDISSVFEALGQILDVDTEGLGRIISQRTVQLPSLSKVFSGGIGGTLIDLFFGELRIVEIREAFRAFFFNLVREYDKQKHLFAKELNQLLES